MNQNRRSRTRLLLLLLASFVLHAVPLAARPTLQAPTEAELAALEWREVGPAITSGRIVAFAVDPRDRAVVYAASASGGAWKTVNHGTTWEPVFSHERSVSLGAIALDPSNPETVWVGTGEQHSVRSSSYGDGVYRSDDGGDTWRRMGLEGTRHVGRILVHPDDSDVVWVAGLGSLWGPNAERGLFKTDDGGESWRQVLAPSEYTGVVEVVMDPRDPDRLFAATFQRERRMWSMLGGGPESGIHHSRDGGETWERVTSGLPEGDAGRIGLAICAGSPDTMYASIVGPEGGIFRSADGGVSWERRNREVQSHWYYGELVCDPTDPDRLYVPMTRMHVSDDGGLTFETGMARENVHGDHHTLWVDPDDSSHLLLGNDGGIYVSWDRGASWQFQANVPVMQLYTVAVDMQEPFYWVYGGTQDNSSWGGPSGTRYSSGIANDDWFLTSGGDGFYSQVDPTDHTIVYSESQYGVLSRLDMKTGERRRIQPWQPQDGGEPYRWNWSAPLQISPHDPAALYFAANVLFKSTDRGDSWEIVSPDLSRGISRDELPLQGIVQPPDAIDLHASTAMYGNVSTISVSPVRPGLLAAGTDDGLIQVSRDDGASWRRSESFPGVPDMMKVSSVVWSQVEEGTLFAAFDGHKDNTFAPFVVRSDDHGASWRNITGDLPEFGSSRVVAVHPRSRDLLFVGTETGVFVSFTGGDRWVSLKNNLPTVAVHGMVVHPRANDLVLGTHGRGFWILDDIGLLEEMGTDVVDKTVHLAQPRPAIQLHDFNRGRGALGDSYWTASNPPRGAILDYWSTEGGKPVVAEVVDSSGEIVRRLDGGTSERGAGRLLWDLRTDPPGEGSPWSRLDGRFVLPGEYTVRVSVGGASASRTLEVRSDPASSLNDAERRAWHDTLARQAALIAGVADATESVGAVLADARDALDAIENRDGPAELAELARSVARAARRFQVRLEGPGEGGIAQQEAALPLIPLVSRLYSTTEGWSGPPTADQANLTDWAERELAGLREELRALLEGEAAELGRRMDTGDAAANPRG